MSKETRIVMNSHEIEQILESLTLEHYRTFEWLYTTKFNTTEELMSYVLKTKLFKLGRVIDLCGKPEPIYMILQEKNVELVTTADFISMDKSESRDVLMSNVLFGLTIERLDLSRLEITGLSSRELRTSYLSIKEIKFGHIDGKNKLMNLENAFQFMMSLEKLDFGGALMSHAMLDDSTFRSCRDLKEVKFGKVDTLKLVNGAMFKESPHLESVDFSDVKTVYCNLPYRNLKNTLEVKCSRNNILNMLSILDANKSDEELRQDCLGIGVNWVKTSER